MVLVGTLLASKMADTSKLETFKSSMVIENGDVTRETYNKSILNSTLSFIILTILILINVIPALLIAYNCSKTNTSKGINMGIAFLFSDIYLFYYTIRKYVYKDKNYC